MSLLEEALRRHDARVHRQVETPGSPPPRDGPAAAPAPRADSPRPPAPPPHIAPASPGLEHAPPPAAAPLQARVVAVVAPLFVLLLFAAFVWLMLRTGRPAGTGPRRPRDTAPELLPETPPAPGAIPQVAETTNLEPMPVSLAVRPPDSPAPPEPLLLAAPTGTTTSAAPSLDPIEAAGFPESGPPWPRVAVKGIAFGRERLVVLDTGEMLSTGERSRTGVRVVRIEPDCAWIEWHGATNMLRKGEDSSKPLQE